MSTYRSCHLAIVVALFVFILWQIMLVKRLHFLLLFVIFFEDLWNGRRFPQHGDQRIWFCKMANAQMAAHWSHGPKASQCLCDVTVPDTYAESHIGDTATETGAAANQAAANKIAKYDELADTHIFYRVVIETGGTWKTAELVQEIGRRATLIPDDPKESTFLFQQLSIDLQRGKCCRFPRHFWLR